MAIKMTRPMALAGVVVCAAAVIALSAVVALNWRNPEFRDEALPLIILFDLVFAYRLFRYWKMLRNPARWGVKTLS